MRKIGLFLLIFLFIVNPPARSQAKPNLDIKDLVIVFKTHFDNGYTQLSETVLNQYATTLIEGALRGIETTASLGPDLQFGWTLSGYPMKEILKRNPALEPAVGTAIREGRFAVHALPFTVETEALNAELLVRGLAFSDEISARYGLEPARDAKLTDVPSHSWILPTLLTHAGIQFLHIGCNPASQSPKVPLLFWWEGPDGSRLMTMYWGGYYGTDLVPPADWPFKTWLAIIHTNDNQGAPPAEEIRRTIDQAKKLAPNAKIRVGRLSDFYDLLMQERPELPVIKGDMPDGWIHGYLSMPQEFGEYNRNLRRVRSVESTGTLLDMIREQSPAINPLIPKATEDLLLFAEHTFGMAMSHGHSGIWRYDEDFIRSRALGEYDLIEHSWQEKGNHVFEASRLLIPGLSKNLEELARSVAVDGPKILVYNPLPYTRSGTVEVRAHSGWYGIRALMDATTGTSVPFENRDNIYRIAVTDIPPMGYKTFVPPSGDQRTETVTDRKIQAKTGLLENDHLKVTIDTITGAVRSVFCKDNGKEMADGSGIHPFASYVYQQFAKTEVESYANAYIKGGWDWAPAELGRPNLDGRAGYLVSGWQPTVRQDRDATGSVITVTYSNGDRLPHKYILVYRLAAHSRALEIICHIEGKNAEPWPEAGWMVFPFNLAEPQFRVGRLGGIVNPATDLIPGSQHDYYLAESGVALFGPDGKGFGITSPDAPAISLDRPGLWKWTGNFIPGKPTVWFNLFNNQWSTNFTEWIEGSWSARFFVWGFNQYDPANSLTIPAGDLNQPMEAVLVSSPAGKAPLSMAGVEVSEPQVTVTALAPDPSSGGYLLRLWETAGTDASLTVTLPAEAGLKSAQPVDLRMRPHSSPIPVVNGRLTVQCKANAPASFILTR